MCGGKWSLRCAHQGTGVPLLGVVGASALSSLLEAWGLPHPLCHGLGVVLACLWCCQDMESQAGSWGLCLGALDRQESGRCHLGWERLFWAASEWPQTQDWGSCPELSYITLSYLIS